MRNRDTAQGESLYLCRCLSINSNFTHSGDKVKKSLFQKSVSSLFLDRANTSSPRLRDRQRREDRDACELALALISSPFMIIIWLLLPTARCFYCLNDSSSLFLVTLCGRVTRHLHFLWLSFSLLEPLG